MNWKCTNWLFDHDWNLRFLSQRCFGRSCKSLAVMNERCRLGGPCVWFTCPVPVPLSQPFTPRAASLCSLPLSSLWVPLLQSELIRKTRQHKSSAVLHHTVSVLFWRWSVLHHSPERNNLSRCSLLFYRKAFNTCRCLCFWWRAIRKNGHHIIYCLLHLFPLVIKNAIGVHWFNN